MNSLSPSFMKHHDQRLLHLSADVREEIRIHRECDPAVTACRRMSSETLTAPSRVMSTFLFCEDGLICTFTITTAPALVSRGKATPMMPRTYTDATQCLSTAPEVKKKGRRHTREGPSVITAVAPVPELSTQWRHNTKEESF